MVDDRVGRPEHEVPPREYAHRDQAIKAGSDAEAGLQLFGDRHFDPLAKRNAIQRLAEAGAGVAHALAEEDDPFLLAKPLHRAAKLIVITGCGAHLD